MKKFLDSSTLEVASAISQLESPDAGFWFFKCSLCDLMRDKDSPVCSLCYINFHLIFFGY